MFELILPHVRKSNAGSLKFTSTVDFPAARYPNQLTEAPFCNPRATG
jgi:hypothetical protein